MIKVLKKVLIIRFKNLFFLKQKNNNPPSLLSKPFLVCHSLSHILQKFRPLLTLLQFYEEISFIYQKVYYALKIF